MAASTNWLAANTAHLTYNSNILECMTLRYRESVGTFDTDNTESGGDHEFGVDVTTRQISFTINASEENLGDMPALKSLVDAVYTDDTGTYTGKARVTSRERQGGGKGGYVWSYEATHTGAVTFVAATP